MSRIKGRPLIDVEEILRLLRETELTGQEIAGRVGCHDSYLPKAVKKRVGVRPSEYRARYGWVGIGQRALSPSRCKEALALYDSYLSVAEIASRMGGDKGTIAFAIKQRDGRVRPPGDYRRKPLPEEEIAKRYLAFENAVQLGEAYGVSERQIRRILDRQKVPRRRPGYPRMSI